MTALDLDTAQAHVQALDALLQEEFEALRTQSFDRIEALQSEKVARLEALQTTSQQIAALPEAPPAWAEVLQSLTLCRDQHRRNELLISRQIEVVGATLRSLQLSEPSDSVDLYDRMGQVARRGARRAYSEA
jgi:flagellar biosynthesis/type III secretory pathway chaperone